MQVPAIWRQKNQGVTTQMSALNSVFQDKLKFFVPQN